MVLNAQGVLGNMRITFFVLFMVLVQGCNQVPSISDASQASPLPPPQVENASQVVEPTPNPTIIFATARVAASPTSLPIVVAPTENPTPKAPKGGPSGNPSISANGRFVAFESEASNLVARDSNDASDIFVYDRETQSIERVSISSDGTEANGASLNPSISADGRWIAFMSWASNLVSDDSNQAKDSPTESAPDIFVRDRQTGKTKRISVASDGTQANERSDNPAISDDGRWIAFVSWADNLVPADTNRAPDIFVHDRETGLTERVSISSKGEQSDGWSYAPAISQNGNIIAFVSQAKNLVANAMPQFCSVFIRNRATKETSLVSVDENGAILLAGGPTLSADASQVGFWNNNVYVRNLETSQTTLVSLNVLTSGDGGHCHTGGIRLSGSGAVMTYAAQDNQSAILDIFLYELNNGKSIQITKGNASSNLPALSEDGRWVAFQSRASNLVSSDTNRKQDVFLYDRVTEIFTLVSAVK